VLHGVLDVWLSYMAAITENADDPELALRRYIAGKLRFSREHPYDSRVYANEVISGAPLFAQEIRDRVVPALQADIAVFNAWAEQGVCRKVDAAHLMVILWSSTQAYADFASQICLVLGKDRARSRGLRCRRAAAGRHGAAHRVDPSGGGIAAAIMAPGR
jgi:TetR/AcrR family transcriptional regulator